VTSAETAFGGSIFLDGPPVASGTVRIIDSDVLTSVLGGSVGTETRNDAGNIRIATAGPIVVQRSDIRANATKGTGGVIDFISPLLLRSESIVSASAGPEGISGRVNIESPVSQLSENFTPLRVSFLPGLRFDACTSSGEASAFTTAAGVNTSAPFITWPSVLRMSNVPSFRSPSCLAESLTK
jgi:hypothetical protein